MKYNVWNPWDPLKKVVLGDTYRPEFFKDIKSQKIKSALTQISEETHEDLESFENILKQFGCEVIRPTMDLNDNIMSYVDDRKGIMGVVPNGPLQPRDHYTVIGNELFITSFNKRNSKELKNLFFEKENTAYLNWPIAGSWMTNDVYNVYARDAVGWPDYDTYRECFKTGKKYSIHKHIDKEIHDAHLNWYSFSETHDFIAPESAITVVGKDLYINLKNNPYFRCSEQTDQIFEWFQKRYSDFRINIINVDGHSDGSFNLLKPGVIVSVPKVQEYSSTFPGWDIFFIKEDKGKFQIPDFWRSKKDLFGKWWVPGQENNDEFNAFVQRWLGEWVGYVEESVFDCNVTMLDEHHVCVTSLNNKDFLKFLKKHKIEPVLVPWRHRFFWDGGLHCITLELDRAGKQQDYFPNRLEPVFDKGYDYYEL